MKRPPLEDPDQDLVARYLSGDTHAFHELMRRHEDWVFAVCLRIVGDRESALDAVQDTFLTLYRKAGRYQGRSAFSTWLYRVAVNTCYDLLRRRRRQETRPLDDVPENRDSTQQDLLEAVELRPDVETALRLLSDEFRAVVVLVDLQDLSLQETAEILGVPVGTIKSRVFRARRLLAESLGNLAPPSVHRIGEEDA